MYEIYCRSTRYFHCDSRDVRQQLHRHYVLWLPLEAGMCAKKELSPLQIHSLGMVVIPPIHSNLIWQKVVCMTEPWTPIGGRWWGGGEWRTCPGKLNDSGGGFPVPIQYTRLINLIHHLEMTLYAAWVQPDRFTLQCAVDLWGGAS